MASRTNCYRNGAYGVIKTDENTFSGGRVKQRQVAVRSDASKSQSGLSYRPRCQMESSKRWQLINQRKITVLIAGASPSVIRVGLEDDAVAMRPFFYSIGAGTIDVFTHFD